MYKGLGLSKAEVKEKLLADVENNTDPISVLQQLAKKGAILDIAEEPGDDEQPPALTE
jgi:hypothetical protein